MTTHVNDLATPTVIVDIDRLRKNIQRMQDQCNAHGVQLWPHIKTHKMIAVARMQLEAGATGLTCAKLGEAEALLPSGVKRVFIAHSLVDPMVAPRIKALAGQLDELVLAVTSPKQAPALNAVLAAAGLKLPVMMAIDSGLHREGVRGEDQAVETAALIDSLPQLQLKGIYTHEGFFYGMDADKQEAAIDTMHQLLINVRKRINPSLELWPGCSVTARRMAAKAGITAVRPGAYPFGDLALAHTLDEMKWDEVALTVLACVVDQPEPGLALIDAGSKVFSSDKTKDGFAGLALDHRKIQVVRCNEEHGYLNGGDVDALKIGEKLRFIPAHVCTVVNLTDTVTVVSNDTVVDRWTVDGRGRVQ